MKCGIGIVYMQHAHYFLLLIVLEKQKVSLHAVFANKSYAVLYLCARGTTTDKRSLYSVGNMFLY